MRIFAPAGADNVSKLRAFYRKWKHERRRARERALWKASSTKMYDIRAGYRHRIDNSYFDDFKFNAHAFLEEAQREVYERAVEETKNLNATLVFDVGCGAGKKLVRYFNGDVRTIGFDVPETVAKLKAEYPNREWRSESLSGSVDERPDIVICADVIEHIPNPDELVGFLKRLKAKRYFISTPDRLTMYGRDQDGPPSNATHCREWTLAEFETYIGRSFRIVEHYISNERDHTQLAICELKPEDA